MTTWADWTLKGFIAYLEHHKLEYQVIGADEKGVVVATKTATIRKHEGMDYEVRTFNGDRETETFENPVSALEFVHKVSKR